MNGPRRGDRGAPGSADLARYAHPVPDAALRRLAALPADVDDQRLRAEFDTGWIRRLLTERGIVVLCGLDRVPPARWPVVFGLLCRALGTLLPQSETDRGQLVRTVTHRGGGLGEKSVRYSDSRTGASYHTDGVPVSGPLPDLIALLCVRQAPTGGELVFLDSADVLDAARGQLPGIDAVLGSTFHFDQRRADAPAATVRRRVVEPATAHRPARLVYLRDYLDSGHAVPGIRPLTAAEVAAMDLLDRTMADESLHIEGRLAPGQIALSDNHRYLHGRHDYRDGVGQETHRLMLRCWIAVDHEVTG